MVLQSNLCRCDSIVGHSGQANPLLPHRSVLEVVILERNWCALFFSTVLGVPKITSHMGKFIVVVCGAWLALDVGLGIFQSLGIIETLRLMDRASRAGILEPSSQDT